MSSRIDEKVRGKAVRSRERPIAGINETEGETLRFEFAERDLKDIIDQVIELFTNQTLKR
jgi:hypothetical protein